MADLVSEVVRVRGVRLYPVQDLFRICQNRGPQGGSVFRLPIRLRNVLLQTTPELASEANPLIELVAKTAAVP
jgi:hypothetical protein